MKFEIGKKYIASNNKEVRIICIDAMIDRGVEIAVSRHALLFIGNKKGA